MKTFRQPLCAAALLLGATQAFAQGFALEGAVIDSRSGSSLGVVTERGELNALFRAQKAMTFGILRSAGIPLDSLSPEVRARIERFATTNLEAFRAFSQGLDLKDQGKFAEARELFRRAAELDPNFALAQEQRVSMPDVNITGGVQLRAVLSAAAGAAVERGKAAYAVDLARAVAALQAGQNVVLVDSSQLANPRGNDFSVNDQRGGGSGDGSRAAASLAYEQTVAPTLTVTVPAVVGEIGAGDVVVNNGVLVSMGSQASGFLASRANATVANTGSTTLGDGSVAYWGSWLSAAGSSAVVSAPGLPAGGLNAANGLGRVDYVVAAATRNMPTVGSFTFTPAGGLMQNATGTIAVNFASQSVTLQNLGFTSGSYAFANLNGSSTYAGGGGLFQGSFTSGSCTGCPGFIVGSSQYLGSFAGAQANGLVLTTVMVTGAPSNTVGMHVFRRP
jgi:hypothetical protein